LPKKKTVLIIRQSLIYYIIFGGENQCPATRNDKIPLQTTHFKGILWSAYPFLDDVGNMTLFLSYEFFVAGVEKI